MVSSSPDLRDEIVARAARWPEMSLFAFDWRKYLKQAPPKIRKMRTLVDALVYASVHSAAEAYACTRIDPY
eukprot:5971955-Pleurochrysis_carterae.AAC.1